MSFISRARGDDHCIHRKSATLKIVLAINAVMFVVELAVGLLGDSTGGA